ncbi:MAG: signal recognition particle-docking protein FtsY [Chloroflexi bacterium]|nr:signal recognition particle-docking protein FtsY [Chloroflexota bacterium]
MDLWKKTEQGIRRTKDAWLGRMSRLFEGEALEQEAWEELEEALIAADVGLDTTQKLLTQVKEKARRQALTNTSQLRQTLMTEMISILQVDGQRAASTPSGLAVILVVGVNGVGKTTSIAKLAYALRQEGKGVIIAAGDTFRAAAIDQLKVWGQRLGVTVIANRPGADPGAVVFDAITAAKARGADVLIVDTAGRLHTKYHLMEELKKIQRVVTRAEASCQGLLVLDATTGQNGLIQARHFAETVGIDGIFLAKLDGTAKGGIVLAICDQLNIPILYIGTGEGVEDMAPFDAQRFVEVLFS